MTATVTPGVSAIYNPDTYVHGVPHELFDSLRAESAVAWVDEPAVDFLPPGPGYWAVLRHAEVESVLRRPQVFSSSLGLTQIYDAPPPVIAALRSMMINMDPPEHSRLRGLLARSFTPRAVARLEQAITRRAEELVAAVAGNGECDFVTDIAADLPLHALSEILGVPESDRWLMFDWSNRVIGMLDDEYSGSDRFDPAQATEMARRALAVRPLPDAHGRMPDSRHPSGMADLYAYARELGAYRREHPGNDIMSLLLAEADRAPDTEGGRVSIDEFEKLFWLFSVAGNETVRNALPGGMLALLQHPEQYAALRADPSLVPTAVEEMLRWWTPVIQFRRTAASDTTIDGVPIAAGAKVVVYFASANRDERVFADPHRFDIGRTPNPHLAFGHGPHFCVAAHLARVQMRALFTAIVRDLPQLSQAGEPVRLRSNFQNGVKHLPVAWS